MSDMSITAAIAVLRREIAERQAALDVLERLAKQGFGNVTPAVAMSNGTTHRPRGGKRQSVGDASIEILKAAGRPMHGLREILPALEAQGHKIKHRAGLATVFMRTGKIKRTAPGTFEYAGGDSPAP